MDRLEELKQMLIDRIDMIVYDAELKLDCVVHIANWECHRAKCNIRKEYPLTATIMNEMTAKFMQQMEQSLNSDFIDVFLESNPVIFRAIQREKERCS